MTQQSLIKNLGYTDVIEESFFIASDSPTEIHQLINNLVNSSNGNGKFIQKICESLLCDAIKLNGPILNSEIVINILASALITGFAQGAIAAHKVLQVEELEEMMEL